MKEGNWRGQVSDICFFKKKSAYEITDGDWSSDVCSSDLPPPPPKSAPRCVRPSAAHHRSSACRRDRTATAEIRSPRRAAARQAPAHEIKEPAEAVHGRWFCDKQAAARYMCPPPRTRPLAGTRPQEPPMAAYFARWRPVSNSRPRPGPGASAAKM